MVIFSCAQFLFYHREHGVEHLPGSHGNHGGDNNGGSGENEGGSGHFGEGESGSGGELGGGRKLTRQLNVSDRREGESGGGSNSSGSGSNSNGEEEDTSGSGGTGGGEGDEGEGGGANDSPGLSPLLPLPPFANLTLPAKYLDISIRITSSHHVNFQGDSDDSRNCTIGENRPFPVNVTDASVIALPSDYMVDDVHEIM